MTERNPRLSWALISLLVGLLATITGSMVTIAYQAGGVVNAVRSIGGALEKLDARLGRVESTQAGQATDIAVIKQRLAEPAPPARRR